MLKQLELSFGEFVSLKEYCDRKGICFLSTPFDFESIEFLNSIEMPFWKIPSGEVTNYPYLVALAKTGKPVVMSTGMCEMQEIEDAITVLRENGTSEIKLLHCNTEYPTPYEDVNLRAMKTLRDAFGVEVGYSDHTKGIEVPIAAVAMGAAVIEKHFTLDRNMEGPDHKASLEPQELKQMFIEQVEKLMPAQADMIKQNIDTVISSGMMKFNMDIKDVYTMQADGWMKSITSEVISDTMGQKTTVKSTVRLKQ